MSQAVQEVQIYQKLAQDSLDQLPILLMRTNSEQSLYIIHVFFLKLGVHGMPRPNEKWNHNQTDSFLERLHSSESTTGTIAPRIRYLSRTETRMEDMNHLSINHPVCQCYSPLYRYLPMDTIQMGRDTVTFVGFFFCFLFWSLDYFLNIC